MHALYIMRRILHHAPDLLPDHPIALGLAGLWGIWGVLEPKMMVGAALLFLLNVVVSYLLEYKTDKEYGEVFQLSVTRFVGYLLAGALITVFSWMMGGVDVLGRIVWGGMGGIEVAVGLGMLARIIPRIRPLWVGVVRWVDDNTPLTMSVGKVNTLIDSEQSPDE